MSGLKILHISENDLEDPRVIKSAITGKENGNQVFFCGQKPQKIVTKDVFEKTEWINVSNKAKVADSFIPGLENFWPWFPYPKENRDLKKQIHCVIKKINPDIIHAHNIFVGHHTLDEGIPLVFDDHELYSLGISPKMEKGAGIKKKIYGMVKRKIWSKWEDEIAEKCPIITQTNAIAEHYKKKTKDVFVVPNYPTKDFIKLEKFNNAEKGNICSIYIGKDKITDKNPTRDIRGLYDIFTSGKNIGYLKNIGVTEPNNSKIQSFGYVHFQEAYQIMQHYGNIGLIPFHKNWWHAYQSPNKAYEYAHNGLWLICVDDMEEVVKDFGKNCDLFSSYDELVNLLEYYNNNPEELNKKRMISYKMAKDKLIWENKEEQILQAYKKA